MSSPTSDKILDGDTNFKELINESDKIEYINEDRQNKTARNINAKESIERIFPGKLTAVVGYTATSSLHI